VALQPHDLGGAIVIGEPAAATHNPRSSHTISPRSLSSFNGGGSKNGGFYRYGPDVQADPEVLLGPPVVTVLHRLVRVRAVAVAHLTGNGSATYRSLATTRSFLLGLRSPVSR
jgi:hypothetical protein